MEEPTSERRWTVDEVVVFMTQSIAEVEAEIKESTELAARLLAERATTMGHPADCRDRERPQSHTADA